MNRKLQMPKKILSVFLCVLVLFSCVPMSVISASAVGAYDLTVTIDTGEKVTLIDYDANGYYEILDPYSLYAFSYAVNGGNSSINGELIRDIHVNYGQLSYTSTDARKWIPIGNSPQTGYRGTFNGNNHTIFGLYYNDRATNFVGLFGFLEPESRVLQTNVEDSYFYGMCYVGGIAGENYGTITECYNSMSEVCGFLNVGGVVGCNIGTITNSYNIHYRISGMDSNAGGVAGLNHGTITECYNSGDVDGSDYVGGVVGYNDNGTITNSYNIGRVNGSDYIGGVAGENYRGIITECYNTYRVSGTDYVGGVAGENLDRITNSYYLSDSETDSFDGTIAKTSDQFESGEVAFLLQGEQTDEIWGQKIGTDRLPVLGGDKVYYGYTSCADDGTAIYTNNANASKDKPEHKFENGFCTGCDLYESATLNADGYYEIDNSGKLYWFADKVNNDNANFGTANAILTANIVVNDGTMSAESTNVREWTPIGNDSNRYRGTFNGNDYTVSGLYFNNTETERVGLFGYLGENGTVKNTGVINSYFNGKDFVGGVVAWNNNGTITNCYNTGKVSGGHYIGGVAGYSPYGTIINCYNTGTVSGSYKYIGGVAGENYSGKITNSYNTGEVSGTDYVGGVAGWNNNGTIANSYNTGGASGSSDVGSVIGKNSNGTNTNCYYLSDSETDSFDGTIAKTADQFASGEVAYLLQGEQTDEIWGQKISEDELPVLGGDKVYYGYISCADDVTICYTNNEKVTDEKPKHDWKDSTCLVCLKVCSHTWENGVCSVCTKACEHDWDYYSTCTICSLECAHKELRAEFIWENPYQDECYVSVDLYCTECGGYIASDSAYVGVKESVEAVDCMHNGSKLYEATFEYEDVPYTDTKKFVIKSDNHTGEFVNGFCSDCGGFEPAKYNEEADVYEISNAGQLYWYAQKLNEENLEIHAKLTKDIIIPENAPEWVPINCSYAYFDGNFKTISGLKCIGGENDRYVGLFGNEGWWYEISNLHITNSYFEGNDYVGAVVACISNGGYVTNCYVTNTTVKGDSDNVGTLVGYSIGHIINCYVDTDTLVGYYNSEYGSVENSYYLADEETDSYDGTTAKTADQFASGEVAYLLQAGVAEEDIYDDDWNYIETIIPEIWGQKIGTDTYPVLDGDKVYTAVNCIGETAGYSNTEGKNIGHIDFENGFCKDCDAYEPATLNADGYYEIDNAGKLYWFADKVNNDNANFGSENAILTADIVVNEGEMTAETENARAWTPIGTSSTKYTGTFNGNNHTVSGLYFNNTDTKRVGLFGYIGEKSTIENTGVINSYFNGNEYVGGVVGYNSGAITNCYNTGGVSGEYFAGGVASYNSGAITNCYNTGVISGRNNVGGVVGYNNRTITNCYNTGEISATYGNVGGVAGYNKYTITNCYNTGEVSGEYYVGGVVGYYYDGPITNCYNTGGVSGEYYVGGIFSKHSNGTSTNCYNTGKVSGIDYVGGVTGYNGNGIYTNCYYLEDSETDELDGTTAKTADQFASGEVAYLLQGEQTENVWGQKIGEDNLPVLGGKKVYYGYVNCTDKGYSNIVLTTEPLHSDLENGFCTGCGAYEPATLNADGYYEIDNAGKLYWFADKVNNSNEKFGSANAILTADIVVNEGEMTAETENARAWTPIGNNYYMYTGTFNGNNHTVSGLYFNTPETSFVGLFGWLDTNGAVENIGVINSYFNGNISVGGVVGDNSGTIKNCYNIGEVNGTRNVGGVAGFNHTIIKNCYNTGEVNGINCVGGVVGANDGTIKNCYNTGGASGSSNVGGVIGKDSNGTITNCYYLSDSETDSLDGTTAKTADQFASGEVAYLLQGEQTEQAWGQKIGEEELPVLGGDKVYYGYTSCADDETAIYTNNANASKDKPAHKYENGFCTVCGAYEPATTNADGYYEIDNAGKLYWFAEYVNTGNTSVNAILTADIVVNEGKMTAETENARAWTPIGNDSNTYIGTFNGNNHTVSGLYFNNTETDYVGLVGYVDRDAKVKNIGVINSYFNGGRFVGGVAGYSTGIITNSYNTGEVNGTWYVGGVAGENFKATIANSYNTGKVSSANNASGIANDNYNGTIINCYNTGEVSGTNVGGISELNGFGIIINCYNTGKVSGTGDVGDVVGVNMETITNCYYLSDSETDSLDGTTAKTADQFASGEVAYLLNNGVTDGTQVWYQNIDNGVDEYDDFPMYAGDTVYRNTNCTESNISYSNTSYPVDHIYNQYHVCKDCMSLKPGEAAGIYGFSIGLGGNISVKYYTVIDEEVAADPTAKMVFTVPNGDSNYTVEVPVSEAVRSGKLYIFECKVAAKEITSEILCQLVSSTAEGEVFSYSVKEYAEVILANPDTYAKEIPLVKAMLNYSANAQVYFDYNTDDLANDSMFMTEDDKALVETLDLSEYAHTIIGEQEGVSFYGAVLSLESETAIKLYFNFENEADVETLDITVDGNAIKPEKNGKYYEVRISGMPANYLDKMYEIKVGNLTLNYGAFSYGNIAMGTSKDNLKNLIKAMYAYNQAAIEYLG